MSTEIAAWEEPNTEITPMNTGVVRLVDWAREADAALSLAQKLTNTAFCPEQFRGKPGDAAAAMLAGGELGLSPLTAMGAFDVIQGRASARAITIRALAQAQGHEIVMVESTSTRCRMKGRRRGSSEWQTVDWTIDRAKQLGVTGKANWRNQPQAMLVARATSEICRLVASDALLGIAGGYSTEELADGADVALAVTVEPQSAPKTRTVGRRKPAAKPEPKPEPEPEAELEPESDPITQKQLTALNAGLTGIVGNGRADKLAWLTHNLDREITSSKDLTKDEASQLIDWMNQAGAGETE